MKISAPKIRPHVSRWLAWTVTMPITVLAALGTVLLRSPSVGQGVEPMKILRKFSAFGVVFATMLQLRLATPRTLRRPLRRDLRTMLRLAAAK